MITFFLLLLSQMRFKRYGCYFLIACLNKMDILVCLGNVYILFKIPERCLTYGRISMS